jgi:drug/metabolite transporter (DMT)-like permease
MNGGRSLRGVPTWAPLIVVVVLCNGLAAGVWKHANLDVATFCFAFVAGKTLVLWSLWSVFGRRPLVDGASIPFLRAAFFSALLNGIAWFGYFVAFMRGPLALVQTITATSAVVAAVLGVIFLNERFVKAQWIGVALVVAAGMGLGYSTDGSGDGGQSGWLFPSILGAFLWGASNAACKVAYSRPEADDYRMNLAHWAGLVLTLLPYGIWLLARGEPRTGGAMAAIAVVALYITADLAYYAAIRLGPVSLVSPLADLYPIVSTVYALLFLNETPSGFACLCIALALPGIFLVIPNASSSAAKHSPTRILQDRADRT